MPASYQPARWRPRIWSVSAGLLLAGAFSLGWIGSERLLKPPRRPLEIRHREAIEDPARFGFALGEAFQVATADEIVLQAHLLTPSSQPGEAVKTRRMRERLKAGDRPAWGEVRGTVVMLHGRGGLKEDAFPVAERFVAAGLVCVIYDARAHGESGGQFTTYGDREVDDLSAVIDAAEEKWGERLPQPIFGFGISQGAAVLLQALPREPRLSAAVAVAPFSELGEVMKQAVANQISPSTPSLLTWGVLGLGGLRAGFNPGEIKPVSSAAGIRVPVMVVHGENDGVIPIEQGRQIFEALPDGRKAWRPVPEGFHGNVLAVGGDALYQEMIEFWLRTGGKSRKSGILASDLF